jgi:hypothetical protein
MVFGVKFNDRGANYKYVIVKLQLKNFSVQNLKCWDDSNRQPSLEGAIKKSEIGKLILHFIAAFERVIPADNYAWIPSTRCASDEGIEVLFGEV